MTKSASGSKFLEGRKRKEVEKKFSPKDEISVQNLGAHFYSSGLMSSVISCMLP